MQALQGLVHALFPVPAVQRFDLALHGIQVAVAQAIFFNQADHPLQARTHRHENSGFAIQRWLLRHVGNSGAGLHLQGAVVGFFHASQDFEHA